VGHRISAEDVLRSRALPRLRRNRPPPFVRGSCVAHNLRAEPPFRAGASRSPLPCARASMKVKCERTRLLPRPLAKLVLEHETSVRQVDRCNIDLERDRHSTLRHRSLRPVGFEPDRGDASHRNLAARADHESGHCRGIDERQRSLIQAIRSQCRIRCSVCDQRPVATDRRGIRPGCLANSLSSLAPPSSPK